MLENVPNFKSASPEYAKALETLYSKVKNVVEITEKVRIFEEFADKFTVIPDVGVAWLKFVSFAPEGVQFKWNAGTIKKKLNDDFPGYIWMEWPGKVHFRYDYMREWPELLRDFNASNITRPWDKDDKTHKYQEHIPIEYFIAMPHSQLKYAFGVYEAHTTEPIDEETIEKFQRACDLYDELEACDPNDGAKLVSLLKKTQNNTFIEKNINCKIGGMPWNKSLWLAYIQFLEDTQRDPKDILQVYSRYCRLFVEDTEVRQKYRAKLEASTGAPGTVKYWADYVKFEVDFNSQLPRDVAEKVQFDPREAAKVLLEVVMAKASPEALEFYNFALDFVQKYGLEDMKAKLESFKDEFFKSKPGVTTYDAKEVMKATNFRNFAPQKFSVGEKITTCLMNNTNYTVLRKLYHTCKFFYAKVQLTIVHNLQVAQYFEDQSDFGQPIYRRMFMHVFTSFNFKKFDKLWLTGTLRIVSNDCEPCYPRTLVPKIAKNNLRCLEGSEIPLEDFKILVASPNLISLKLGKGQVLHKNGSTVPLEDILELTPTITYFSIQKAYVKNPSKLLKLKFQNKFEFFNCWIEQKRNPNLAVDDFYEFLQKHLAPRASLCMFYGTVYGKEPFYEALEAKVKTWTPSHEAPRFSRFMF